MAANTFLSEASGLTMYEQQKLKADKAKGYYTPLNTWQVRVLNGIHDDMKEIEQSKIWPFTSYSPCPHEKSIPGTCLMSALRSWGSWSTPLQMTNMWSMKKSWEGTIRRWDATCWEARWRWDYVGLRWDYVERQITSWSSWLKRCIFFNWRQLSNFALSNANTIYNPTFELRTHWSGDTLYR